MKLYDTDLETLGACSEKVDEFCILFPQPIVRTSYQAKLVNGCVVDLTNLKFMVPEEV